MAAAGLHSKVAIAAAATAAANARTFSRPLLGSRLDVANRQQAVNGKWHIAGQCVKWKKKGFCKALTEEQATISFGARRDEWTTEMQQEAMELNELKEELHSLVDEISNICLAGDKQAATALADANLEAVQEQVASGLVGVEQAAMLQCLARVYGDMGSSRAETTLEQAAQALLRLEPQHSLLWDVISNVADHFAEIGQFSKAIQFFNLALCAQDPKNVPLKFRTETRMGLAAALADGGDHGGACDVWREVTQLWEEEEGPDSMNVAIMLRHLGFALLKGQKLDEAESAFGRALEICDRQDGRYIQEKGLTLMAVAQLEAQRGAKDVAAAAAEVGLGLLEECGYTQRDENFVKNVREWLQQMRSNEGTGGLEELDKLEQRVADEEAAEQLDGENFEDLVLALCDLAETAMQLEQWDRATPPLQRLAGLLVEHSKHKEDMASVLRDLAFCHLRMGELERAEDAARDNLRLRDELVGASSSVEQGDAYWLLAEVLREQGRLLEEERALGCCLRILAPLLGPDHENVLTVARDLKRVLKQLGRESMIRRVEGELQARRSNSKSSN